MRNSIDFKITEGKSKSLLLPKVLFKEDPLCVIDLEEIKDLDKENLLPKKGSLVFYYDQKSNANGYNFKNDRKYYRCEYLENPKEFKGGYSLSFSSKETLPEEDDARMLGEEGKENNIDFTIRMLGWPHLLTDNMTLLLELNRRGYDLKEGFSGIAPYVIKKAKEETINWILLLELDSNKAISFGDSGSLYFYIRKEDLLKRDFTKVWLMREEF